MRLPSGLLLCVLLAAFAGGRAHGQCRVQNAPSGRTWHFQALHRDRTGAGVDLTNALSIGITP